MWVFDCSVNERRRVERERERERRGGRAETYGVCGGDDVRGDVNGHAWVRDNRLGLGEGEAVEPKDGCNRRRERRRDLEVASANERVPVGSVLGNVELGVEQSLDGTDGGRHLEVGHAVELVPVRRRVQCVNTKR